MAGGEKSVHKGGGVSVEGRARAVHKGHLLLQGSKAMKVELLLSRHHPQGEQGVGNRGDCCCGPREGSGKSWDGRESAPSCPWSGQWSRALGEAPGVQWDPKGPLVHSRPGHISMSSSQWQLLLLPTVTWSPQSTVQGAPQLRSMAPSGRLWLAGLLRPP